MAQGDVERLSHHRDRAAAGKVPLHRALHFGGDGGFHRGRGQRAAIGKRQTQTVQIGRIARRQGRRCRLRHRRPAPIGGVVAAADAVEQPFIGHVGMAQIGDRAIGDHGKDVIG